MPLLPVKAESVTSFFYWSYGFDSTSSTACYVVLSPLTYDVLAPGIPTWFLAFIFFIFFLQKLVELMGRGGMGEPQHCAVHQLKNLVQSYFEVPKLLVLQLLLRSCSEHC